MSANHVLSLYFHSSVWRWIRTFESAMSLANYSVPFTQGSYGFGIAGTASAVNSLIYERHRSLPPPFTHTSPNRRHPIESRNDPYRNQYPTRRSDRYYSEPDYVNDKDPRRDEDYPSRSRSSPKRKSEDQGRDWPDHPPGYTRIPNTFNSVPEPGAKTSIHAVLDFDDDFEDYSYEDDDESAQQPTAKTHVTPIEGPILIKNGSVPVVPLYSYPTINNGSLVQIPVSIGSSRSARGIQGEQCQTHATLT